MKVELLLKWSAGVCLQLRRRRSLGDDSESSTDGAIEVTPLLSSDEWAAEAARLEQAGAWRAALRARYRQLVGVLIERKLLSDLPGRTPGEFRVELAEKAPSVDPEFTAVTAMFEAAWFGDVPTGSQQVEQLRRLGEEVLAGEKRTRS